MRVGTQDTRDTIGGIKYRQHKGIGRKGKPGGVNGHEDWNRKIWLFDSGYATDSAHKIV